jgi:hypothetical protein
MAGRVLESAPCAVPMVRPSAQCALITSSARSGRDVQNGKNDKGPAVRMLR